MQGWVDPLGLEGHPLQNFVNQPGMQAEYNKTLAHVKGAYSQHNWVFERYEIHKSPNWWSDGRSVVAKCRDINSTAVKFVQVKYFQCFPTEINNPTCNFSRSYEAAFDPISQDSDPTNLTVGLINQSTDFVTETIPQARKCGALSPWDCFLKNDATTQMGKQACSQTK